MKRVEVSFRGHLDESWSDRLGGLHVTHTAGGNTLLTGAVRDQSALYGLLNSLAGLGLELISVSTFDSLVDTSRRRRVEMKS